MKLIVCFQLHIPPYTSTATSYSGKLLFRVVRQHRLRRLYVPYGCMLGSDVFLPVVDSRLSAKLELNRLKTNVLFFLEMPVIDSIIHPYPQLCTCCASLPWPSRPFQNDSLLEKIPFHKTFKLLNESADQGCALCRLVWSSLVYNCAATSYPKASWMEMSIDLEIFMTDSEFALISTLKHEGEESLNCVPTRFERVKVTEVELTRSMKSRQVKGKSTPHVLELLDPDIILIQHSLPKAYDRT